MGSKYRYSARLDQELPRQPQDLAQHRTSTHTPGKHSFRFDQHPQQELIDLLSSSLADGSRFRTSLFDAEARSIRVLTRQHYRTRFLSSTLAQESKLGSLVGSTKQLLSNTRRHVDGWSHSRSRRSSSFQFAHGPSQWKNRSCRFRRLFRGRDATRGIESSLSPPCTITDVSNLRTETPRESSVPSYSNAYLGDGGKSLVYSLNLSSVVLTSRQMLIGLWYRGYLQDHVSTYDASPSGKQGIDHCSSRSFRPRSFDQLEACARRTTSWRSECCSRWREQQCWCSPTSR